MNRAVLESSSSVQKMIGGGGSGGNPNWWNMIHTMRPPMPYHHHSQQPPPPPPPFLAPLPTHFPSPPPPDHHNQEHLHESWNHLILGGLVGEEEKSAGMMMMNSMDGVKSKQAVESWEEAQHLNGLTSAAGFQVFDTKQDNPTTTGASGGYMVVYGGGQPAKSCVTSLSSNSNMLDFSNKSDARHPPLDHSSECMSTATTGGAPSKKARTQPSSTQSTFKVRKEKLGDRITALHQLVSPFGKTDTASVLLEAIGYIRFLQSQIEALSMPYLGNNGSGNNMRRHQHQSLIQAEMNCLFPEDPGQLLNANCKKRKGTSGHHHHQQDFNEEAKKDLRSKGLCLVPISCTLQVESDNIAADYWAPAAFGGGFRP